MEDLPQGTTQHHTNIFYIPAPKYSRQKN